MSVVVLGAGATGLSLAYLLASQGEQVKVIEAGPRAGGLLAAFEPVPGVRLEHYYHHFFTHDVEINWLFKELGLTDQVTFRPTSMGVYRDGKIYDFNGAKDLLAFSPIGLIDRVRFGASSLLMSYWGALAGRERQPAMEWFDRWAGRRATDAIWRPLMESKFGDSAARIPLAWMAGRIRQRARSRKGTVEQLGYLTGSLQVLVDALVAKLTSMGVEFEFEVRVERIARDADGRFVVMTAAGETIRADQFVSTVPTDVLANLVAPTDPAYSQRLRTAGYIGAICTILILDRPLSPVYWLNVADPGFDFGGVIEQTKFVGPEHYGGHHIVYLSKYLDRESDLFKLSDDALLARQLPQVSKLFGVDVTKSLTKTHVFRARNAANLTDLGFHERIPSMKSPIDGLFVASMPHIYPDERSVNNSIRVAAAAAEVMGHPHHRVPPGNSLAAKYGR